MKYSILSKQFYEYKNKCAIYYLPVQVIYFHIKLLSLAECTTVGRLTECYRNMFSADLTKYLNRPLPPPSLHNFICAL